MRKIARQDGQYDGKLSDNLSEAMDPGVKKNVNETQETALQVCRREIEGGMDVRE